MVLILSLLITTAGPKSNVSSVGVESQVSRLCSTIKKSVAGASLKICIEGGSMARYTRWVGWGNDPSEYRLFISLPDPGRASQQASERWADRSSKDDLSLRIDVSQITEAF